MQVLGSVALDLLGGLVFGFLGAEGYLRYMNLAPSQLQGSHIVLPRNHIYHYDHIALRGCDSNLVHTRNSLGFRGSEPPQDFKNALTVVAVGDSATESFYLSDGKTWPERLQAHLSRQYPSLWINNAGLDGLSTFGYRFLIEENLLTLKPKIILLMAGPSDVGREDLNVEDIKIVHPSMYRTFWSFIEGKSRLITFISNLARTAVAGRHGIQHGNLDVRYARKASASSSTRANAPGHRQETYLRGYEKRLRALVDLCKRNGIVPVLITQPVLYGPMKDDVTGVDLGRLEGPEGLSGEEAWVLLNRYDEITRRVAQDTHIPVIDVARKLPKSTRYFYDYFHFTNAGAERVGDIVSQELSPIVHRYFPAFKKHV